MIEYDLFVPFYEKVPTISTIRSDSCFRFKGIYDFFDFHMIELDKDTFDKLKVKSDSQERDLEVRGIKSERKGRLPVFEMKDVDYENKFKGYKYYKTIIVDKNIDNQPIIIDGETYETEYKYNDDNGKHEIYVKDFKGFVEEIDESIVKVMLDKLNKQIIEHNKERLEEIQAEECENSIKSVNDIDKYKPMKDLTLLEKVKNKIKKWLRII